MFGIPQPSEGGFCYLSCSLPAEQTKVHMVICLWLFLLHYKLHNQCQIRSSSSHSLPVVACPWRRRSGKSHRINKLLVPAKRGGDCLAIQGNILNICIQFKRSFVPLARSAVAEPKEPEAAACVVQSDEE